MLPLSLIALGCASAPVAKTPFTEAFETSVVAAVRTRPPSDSRSSPELHAALFAFTDAVEAGRVGIQRGEKMGDAPAAAWVTVLAEVDRLLARPAVMTAPFDLARSRLVLQSQLAVDAGLYGDFPVAVAEAAQRSLWLLTSRMAELAPARHVDLRKFLWPLAPVVITSPFGTRMHPIIGDYRFHAGLDLLADLAQPVRAAYDGTVVYSGWNGAYGKQIELQHDPHLATRYGHLLSLLVADGARVKRGQVIGLAGSTGLSTGVHLHFELLRDGTAEDPEGALPEPGDHPRPTVAQNGTSPGFPQSSPENPRF
jgi:murein DD-endopeptidase MepM/ murein hydrolase activator NlpD